MQTLGFNNTSPMVCHSRQTNDTVVTMHPPMTKKKKCDAIMPQHYTAESPAAATEALHSTINAYAATLNNVGALHFRRNELDQAMRWYRQGTLALGRILQDDDDNDDEPQGGGGLTTSDLSPSRAEYSMAISKERELVAAAAAAAATSTGGDDEVRLLNLYAGVSESAAAATTASSSLAGCDAITIDNNNKTKSCSSALPFDVHTVSSILFHNMALVHHRLNRLDNAQWLFAASLTAIEQTPLIDMYDVASTVHRIIGQICCVQDKWEKGLEHYNESATLDDQLLFDLTTTQEDRHPMKSRAHAVQDRLSDTLSLIGQLHFAAGNYGKAMEILQNVLSIQRTYLPYKDIKIAATFYNVGKILQEQGQLDEALSYCSWFVKHASSRIGYLHPQVLQALHNIGEIQHQSGCYVEAQRTLKKCTTRRRKSNENLPHRDTAITLMSLGQVHQDIGLPNAALTAYREAMSILSDLTEDVLEEKAAVLWNIAQTHQTMNEFDKALETYETILPIVRSIEIDADSYARLHVSIGNIYLDRGAISEAMASFATAERVSSSSPHGGPGRSSSSLLFDESVSIYMSFLLFADIHPAASAA